MAIFDTEKIEFIKYDLFLHVYYFKKHIVSNLYIKKKTIKDKASLIRK